MNKSPLKLVGKYRIEHFRKGKLLGVREGKNDIVNEGLNKILDTMFNAAAQTDPWAMGLIDGSGTPALANADTMASHGGWLELQDYDEATRPSWNPSAAASQQVTNATQVTFTMNATNTVYGIFITSNNTKGGGSGTLWATAPFAVPIAVVDDDELKVTYTVTAARG